MRAGGAKRTSNASIFVSDVGNLEPRQLHLPLENKYEVDKSKFLIGINAHFSADGAVAKLEFLRADGKSAYVDFPTAAAGKVMLDIEETLGRIQRAALKGDDPRAVFDIGTKHVEKVHGTVALGKAIVSFVLNSGVRVGLCSGSNTCSRTN